MKEIRIFISVILLILIIIFSLQNLNVIPVKLFTWSVSLPKALVIILTYILGMMTGGMLSSLLRNLFSDRYLEKRKTKAE